MDAAIMLAFWLQIRLLAHVSEHVEGMAEQVGRDFQIDEKSTVDSLLVSSSSSNDSFIRHTKRLRYSVPIQE